MRLRSKVVIEEKKFKIVQRAQNAKYIKLEVQRNELRNEQNYQYHRLLSSYLSSSVVDLYQQCKGIAEQPPKKGVVEEEQKTIVKKNQDDIFVEKGDQYYDVPQENNILDDLLNDPIAQKKQEYIEREEVFIEPITSLLAKVYAENKNQLANEPRVSISRKASLKRINQNVRKRLKIKQEEEDLPGRSLSSATVSLSNLITMQPQSKCPTLLELPSKTQWLFSSEKTRKRKDEDAFELRWGSQQLQKFQQRNEKFNMKKGKIDNNVLVVNLSNDEDEYKKYFEKNIQADKSFPPTLQNIPKLQITKTKKYYTQFHDIEYESFIRKYNKKNIFKQFSAKAPYLFPQNYSIDETEDIESINAGKIFVHPPEKVLNKIIYKINDYKFSVAVKNDFSHIQMDINQMIILTFFAKKYIKKFGNDWKSITKFIEMNPIFSNHHITQEIVQEVYQLISKYQDNDKLEEINLWDKKILPFDYYGCYSYAQFGQKLYQKKEESSGEKMEVQSSWDTEESGVPFDFDRYEQMIQQKPEQPVLNELQALEKEYRSFSVPIFQNIYQSEHNFAVNRKNKFERIRVVLRHFEESTKEIGFVPDQKDKKQPLGKVLQDTMNLSKGGELKTACPFRKKKNINERNNQLVKILQALRNKTVNPPPSNAPKKPDDANKPYPPNNPTKSVAPATVSAPPAPAPKPNQPAVDQKKNIQKSPQKPDKKLGAPPKKDRKNKDEQKK